MEKGFMWCGLKFIYVTEENLKDLQEQAKMISLFAESDESRYLYLGVMYADNIKNYRMSVDGKFDRINDISLANKVILAYEVEVEE